VFEKEFSFHAEELKAFNRHLYILAVPNNEIRIFNTQGEVVNVTGGKGDSVGQYQHVISYYPAKDTLAIADTKNQTITYLNLKNNSATRIASPEKLMRVLFLNNRNVITETIDTWKSDAHFNTFKLIDFSNNGSSKSLTLIPRTDYNGMIYDGFFASNRNGAFYINYFYNNITRINSNGEIVYKNKTIDNAALPVVKVSDRGWATYEGDVKIVNFSAAADDRYLYVLSNVQQKIAADQIGYYTDLYNVSDGTYYGSIVLPEVQGLNPGRICVLDDRIYVLYKSHLVCYKINNFK